MNLKSYIIAIGASVLLWSCGSTSVMKNSWAKEQYNLKSDPVEKLLIVAITKDESTRNQVESQLKSLFVGKLPKVQTSHQFVKYGEGKEKLTELIDLGGFSHILTIRLADTKKDIEYTPGQYHSSGYYYGYYPTYYGAPGIYLARTWPATYQPAKYEESVEYTWETNLYSTQEKGMVYSALTSSFKGEGLNRVAESMMKSIAKDLELKGLTSKK